MHIYFSKNYIKTYFPSFLSKTFEVSINCHISVVCEWVLSCLVVSDSLRPHGACQALHCPWNSPGKNTGEFSSPGDLPDPGLKSTSFTSPVLAGRFLTTGTAWEGYSLWGHKRVGHDSGTKQEQQAMF